MKAADFLDDTEEAVEPPETPKLSAKDFLEAPLDIELDPLQKAQLQTGMRDPSGGGEWDLTTALARDFYPSDLVRRALDFIVPPEQPPTPSPVRVVPEKVQPPPEAAPLKGAMRGLGAEAAPGFLKALAALETIGEHEIGGDTTISQELSKLPEHEIYKQAEKVKKFWEEAVPLSESEKRSLGTQIPEMITGMTGYVASGPLAPVTMGMESFSTHIVDDYNRGKEKGLSDDQAASEAMNSAITAGGVQAAVFAFLPPALRKSADKYLIKKFGKDAVSQFIARRLAQSGEMATVMGASRVPENIISGRPVTEGLGQSLGAGAILGGLMPRGVEPPPEKWYPTGDVLRTPPGALAPRVEPPPGLEVATPEAAAAASRRMTAEATAGFEPTVQRPVVPEGPSDPRVTQAQEEGLDTLEKIKARFDLASNEDARIIRNQAFPETRAQVQRPTEEAPNPKRIADELGARFDGEMGDLWSFTTYDAAGKENTSFSAPAGSTPEQVRSYYEAARARYEGDPNGPRPPKGAPTEPAPDAKVLSDLNLKFDGTDAGAAVQKPTPEELEKMSDKDKAAFAALAAEQGDRWAITPGPESEIPGRTFYVKKGATAEEIRQAYNKKLAEEKAANAQPKPAVPTMGDYQRFELLKAAMARPGNSPQQMQAIFAEMEAIKNRQPRKGFPPEKPVAPKPAEPEVVDPLDELAKKDAEGTLTPEDEKRLIALTRAKSVANRAATTNKLASFLKDNGVEVDKFLSNPDDHITHVDKENNGSFQVRIEHHHSDGTLSSELVNVENGSSLSNPNRPKFIIGVGTRIIRPDGSMFDPTIKPAPVAPKAVEGETTPSKLKYPPREVPASQIVARPDLMQFKQIGDEATGENAGEKLEGKWDEAKAGTLMLWEPTNPSEHGLTGDQRYIVANGHHRFAFGSRQGVGAYAAQIFKESDGITAQAMRRLAAEANIADGKGTVYDQVRFLRNADAPRSADEEMGLRQSLGARGRQSATIAFDGSDDLYAAFIAEKVTPAQAEAIASAAPKDAARQQLGLKLALDGKPVDFIRARLERERAKTESPVQTDMFGDPVFDDTKADAEADRVVQIRKELQEQIKSAQNAARNPAVAAKLGIDVKDPEGVLRKVGELKAELARWEGAWWLDPELVAKIKGEKAPPPVEPPGEPVVPKPEPPVPPVPPAQAPEAGPKPPGQKVVSDGQADALRKRIQERLKKNRPPGEPAGAMAEGKESIIAAALRDANSGEIWTDISHPQAMARVPNARNRKLFSGFVTDRGRYVSGAQADRLTGKRMVTSQKLFGNFGSEADIKRAIAAVNLLPKEGELPASAAAPRKAKLDPQIFNDAVQLGANYIESGFHVFEDFSRKMLDDFGPEIGDHLKSIYETAKVTIESPRSESSKGRGPGLQPGLKPPADRIVTARAEFTKPADESVIPPELVQHLDPHQRQGAATAIRSMDERGGTLNADGTGAGKTRQAITVAHYYAKKGFKVLIVTRAETIKPDWAKKIFGGSYGFDSKAMGVTIRLARDGRVAPGEIGVTTYENLNAVRGTADNNTILIFDESHSLKNDSARAKYATEAVAKADKVMFMSATPADKPEHIYYLAPIGIMEGKTVQGQLKDLGMQLITVEKMVKMQNGTFARKKLQFWAKDQTVTDEERGTRFSALFDRMTEKGAMIKREISMEGVHVQNLKISLPPEAHEVIARELTTAATAWHLPETITVDDLGGLKKALVLGNMRRQAEPYKIASAVMLAKRELDAGRQVVIFVSRVNESESGYNEYRKTLGGETEKIRHVATLSAGTAKTLAEALHEAGIHDIAEIHGNADQASLEAMADFQSGKKRVVIATVESGGTGINLDDIVGNAPRTMIMVTAPFDAVGNVQAAGRIWRLKTLSGSSLYYLWGDTGVDDWNSAIIGRKMSMLGAVVEGEVRKLDISDPDRVTTDDYHEVVREPAEKPQGPLGKVDLTALDWKPFTTKKGVVKFVAETTKEVRDWYFNNREEATAQGYSMSKWQGKWQLWSATNPGEAGAVGGVSGAAATAAAPLAPAAPTLARTPKSQRQIITDLAKGLKLPIRFGRLMHPRFGGYFESIANLIRSKRANDIPVVSHEVGHKLDSEFGFSSEPAISAELMHLGDPTLPGSRSSWTPNKTVAYRKGEGMAEFVRHWFTDPAAAPTLAPRLHVMFETVLDANKDFGDVMRQAQHDILVWKNADYQARIHSHISTGDNPNKTFYSLSQLSRDLIDDLHFVRLAVDDAERLSSHKLRPTDNPYVMARLLRGSYGMAETFIRHGVVDYTSRNVRLGSSIYDALKPVAGRIEDFRDWIVAKRAQELHGQGKETGFVPADVDKMVRKFDGDQDFQVAFQKIKDWQDSILKYAVDAGLITHEGAAAMRKMNRDYVPMHRVYEVGAGEPSSTETAGTGRGLNVGRPGSLRALRGSPRDIVDPLETMIKNAYVIITSAKKAAINTAVADLARSPGMASWVTQVAAPKDLIHVGLEKIRKQLEDAGADLTQVPDDLMLQFFQNSRQARFGENTIRILRDGKPQFYQLRRELFDTFHALDKEDSILVMKFLSAPAQLLRAGVTMSPDFTLSNAIRDTFDAAILSKYGALPFQVTLKGLAAILRNPQLVSEWAASGGKNSIEASYFDRTKLQKFMTERITKDLTPAERALVVVKSPLAALRWLSSLSEEATRIGEYQTGYEALLKQGMTPGDARRLAAFDARDRQDFAKGGAKTKALRHAAAFWNAQLQANVRIVQAFKERPLATTLRGLAFVTTLKMAEQAANWNDQDYWDRPQWERDLFFMVPIGKGGDGHTRFMRVPVPFELGVIFGSVPGRILQFAKERNPEAAKSIPSLIFSQAAPNPMPQTLQVLIGDMITGKQGWDIWRGRPVVPESLKDFPPELQWTAQTSLTARKIGKLINFSPMKIDHIIAGTTGGLGKQITYNVLDRAISKATGEPRTAEGFVPGGRFVSTPAAVSSQATEDFYATLIQLREQDARAKHYEEANPDADWLKQFEATARHLSQLNHVIRSDADAETKAGLSEEKLNTLRQIMSDYHADKLGAATPAAPRKSAAAFLRE